MKKLTREELRTVYQYLSLTERRNLANKLEKTLPTLRRYCLEPYSDNISNSMWEKMIRAWPEEIWYEKLSNASKSDKIMLVQDSEEDISIKLNIVGLPVTPNRILLNDIIYVKQQDR